MKRRQENFYAGSRFTRLAERRHDEAWLQAAFNDERTLLLPLWQGRSWIKAAESVSIGARRGEWLDAEQLFDTAVFIGEFNNQYCFAVNILDAAPPVALAGGEFVDLRQTFIDLRGPTQDISRDEAGLLAYARAMVIWHGNHRFCGHCGSATRATQGGHVLRCTHPDCGRSHFPRLDPAIIVLVTEGERVLLGRKVGWPEDRFSTIAGFMEWGESVEEAVAREVYEETGIIVGEVTYHSSQPWPFPSSLMLGFLAQAESTDIQRLDGELADARWFTRDQLFDGSLRLPPSQALSYQLLATWYDLEPGRSFAEDIARLTQAFGS